MAAPKYLKLDPTTGQPQAVTAAVAGGAGNEDAIAALGADGKLALTMMPTGVLDEVDAITASENLSAGDLVNLHNASGLKVRKADASGNKPADGFVLAAVTSGQPADVYFEGLISGLTGLTIGPVFLSDDTAGACSTTPGEGAGHLSQRVGYATSSTTVRFERGEAYLLAA